MSFDMSSSMPSSSGGYKIPLAVSCFVVDRQSVCYTWKRPASTSYSSSFCSKRNPFLPHCHCQTLETFIKEIYLFILFHLPPEKYHQLLNQMKHSIILSFVCCLPHNSGDSPIDGRTDQSIDTER